MSERPSSTGISRFATIFFILCLLGLAYCLYLVFRSFLSIFIWACVLTVVFHPVFERVLRTVRGHRTLASIIICLLILVLIVGPLTSILVLVGRQSIALYHGFQESVSAGGGGALASLQDLQNLPWVQKLLHQAGRWLGSERIDLQAAVNQALGAVSKFVVSSAPSWLAGIGGILYGFLMMFIFMFFLFRDGPELLEIVKASNPLPAAYESAIIKNFQDVSYAVFIGSILTAILQGAVATLIFWALGIPAPIFWGAVVAFAVLVPIVGGFLVWIPMSGYLFLSGQTTRGIILLVLGGGLVSSIDNVVKPMIIRGRTDIHPLLVFLSVLGGMQVFGLLGILLGPLIVAVFLTFLNFYRQEFSETLRSKRA